MSSVGDLDSIEFELKPLRELLMMYAKPLAAFAAAFLFAGVTSANAATMSQTESFNLADMPGNQTLTFDGFDDAGGSLSLTSVELQWDATLNGSGTATNNSDSARSLTLILDATLDASGPGGFTDSSSAFELEASMLGAGDSVPVELEATTNSNSFLYAGFGDYLNGPGSVDFDVSGDGYFVGGGGGGMTMAIESFTGTGDVTLIYNYDGTAATLVPSPATLPAALALMGMFAARRRRRRTEA
ncbi:MAG: choice-of-anchor E domain-containing protein [Phycisphaeraceae bacterium]